MADDSAATAGDRLWPAGSSSVQSGIVRQTGCKSGRSVARPIGRVRPEAEVDAFVRGARKLLPATSH